MRVFTFLVVAAALSQSGCAEHLMNRAQETCSTYGFVPGTTEYATCVQRDFERRQAGIQRAIQNMSQQGQAPAQQAPVGGGTAQGVAFFKTSYVSGMNRICLYNRLGSQVAYTVGATDLCPMTLP